MVGLLTGVLSGCGIGGGSLLLLWLTLVQDMPQFTAGGINLLYFGAKELFTKRKNPGTDPKPSSSNRVTRENHGGSPPRNP